MNVLEYEMIDMLKRLKYEYGVFEIKAEYESEGSRQVELMRLKDVVDRVDLPIILKIGGVEALTDMYEALSLGARGIIAPMAETAFAASKFLNMIDVFVPEDNQRDIEFAINIETITAFQNLDEILRLPKLNLLQSITVGRVDFCGSMGKDRKFADSPEILDQCITIFRKVREKKLKTALGGAISNESELFIRTLVDQNLIDKYETRKLVYRNTGVENFVAGLTEGIKFELLWLKSKRRYYHRIHKEDEKRIAMLEARVAEK
ncbi:MAG TPA: aldolase/citrate lyase family protein [Candidatus Ozemobacteraceae bacterium]|nr:aldolase/citrate lyase family protein [Candidatus Ozemobacteraceae bacterium]